MKWDIVNVKDGNWAFHRVQPHVWKDDRVDGKLTDQVEAHTDVIVLTGY